MPMLNVYTSAEPLGARAGEELLKGLSRDLARYFGKPESYVMTCLVPRTRMTFGGTTEPACYVEVKNVGAFSDGLARTVTRELGEKLSRALGVAQNRIYVELTEPEGRLWGYDGDTFG